MLIHQQQKVMLHKFVNSRNFHGTMLSGSVNQGHNINFDEFPTYHQEVCTKRRKTITVVDPSEE